MCEAARIINRYSSPCMLMLSCKQFCWQVLILLSYYHQKQLLQQPLFADFPSKIWWIVTLIWVSQVLKVKQLAINHRIITMQFNWLRTVYFLNRVKNFCFGTSNLQSAISCIHKWQFNILLFCHAKYATHRQSINWTKMHCKHKLSFISSLVSFYVF